MMDIVEKARLFATAAHGAISHRRQYTDEPYILHPAAVVALVAEVGGSPAQLAAAWLHDVVEDTGVEIDDIRAEFGDEVAQLVDELTDVSKPSDGNRAARKAIDRQHTASASPAAKTVKLGDLINNAASITAGDPGFAKVYMEEKRLLLEVLGEGEPTLYARASALVSAYFAASTDMVAVGAAKVPQIKGDLVVAGNGETPPLPEDIVKEIAMDIGKEVAAHIETMYPAAITATTRNMLRSVRNCTFNEIMAALNTTDIDAIRRRLAQRAIQRRQFKAAMKGSSAAEPSDHE